MKYKEVCPKCGEVSSDKKFNFCPLCGTTIKGVDLKSISSAYHPTRMPAKVEKVLNEMGVKEGERNKFLGSIGYSTNPSNVISGHAGEIKNG